MRLSKAGRTMKASETERAGTAASRSPQVTRPEWRRFHFTVSEPRLGFVEAAGTSQLPNAADPYCSLLGATSSVAQDS